MYSYLLTIIIIYLFIGYRVPLFKMEVILI